jgi:glycosyltransferase involved in cell wall biosynthesis
MPPPEESPGSRAADRPPPSISCIISALNEEQHVEAAVRTAAGALQGLFGDWEIILVDDGSTDRTGEVMDRLAAADPRVRVLHNPRNLGLGGAYKRGLAAARKEYVVWVGGDNAESEENLRGALSQVGRADIVIPCLVQRDRPLLRRWASQTFVALVNALFGLRVRYYNGPVVHRREIVQGIAIGTDSFAYQAEALVKLLRAGHSYVEVEYRSARFSGAESKGLRPGNIAAVLATLARLFWWAHFGQGRRR